MGWDSRFSPVIAGAALFCAACGEPQSEAEAKQPERRTNEALFAERLAPAAELEATGEQEAVAQFRKVWARHQPVFQNKFLGVSTVQNPLDAWIVMEIIHEVAPDLIIETGTYHGGSAMLWALILEQVNPEGRVITIDIEDQREAGARRHAIAKRRVDFLLGSSTAPEVVAEVHRRSKHKRVLVLLDSLHTAEHVAAELEAYAPLVPVGSYVIVQDSPLDAVGAIDAFLAANPGWTADRAKERFRLTNTVRGYLRRER